MTLLEWLRTLRRVWYVALVGLLLTGCCVIVIHRSPGVWTGSAQVVLFRPAREAQPNPLDGGIGDAIRVAAVIEREVNGGPDGPRVVDPAVTLADEGVTRGGRVELFNSGSQWANDFSKPVLEIQVVDVTEEAATDRLTRLIDAVRTALAQRQDAAGVIPANRITMGLAPPTPVVAQDVGHRKRAMGAVIFLGLLLTLLVAQIADHARVRYRDRRRESGSVRPAAGADSNRSLTESPR